MSTLNKNILFGYTWVQDSDGGNYLRALCTRQADFLTINEYNITRHRTAFVRIYKAPQQVCDFNHLHVGLYIPSLVVFLRIYNHNNFPFPFRIRVGYVAMET